MHDIGEGTIRRIDWTELVPAVLLLRIFNTALGLRILGIAFCGVLLTMALGEDSYLHGIYSPPIGPASHGAGMSLEGMWNRMTTPGGFFLEAANIRDLPSIRSGTEWKEFFCFFGTYFIWLVCGTLICRIAAVRLTIDESESSRQLLRFTPRRLGSMFNSFFILTAGFLLCYLPVFLAWKLLTVPVIETIVGILLPIPLLFAFLAVFLLLGLAAGFPLLFAAVCTDGSDGFDAISRTFSYIYQRPLHYILYWIYAAVLGYLGYLLIWLFIVLMGELLPGVQISEPFSGNGNDCVTSWLFVCAKIPAAYLFGWFFTSGTAIYLLLRRSVDATPFHEVYRTEPVNVRHLQTEWQAEEHAVNP